MRRLGLFLLLPLLLASCGGGGAGGSEDEGVKVVASFYPLAFVGERVGGNEVDVKSLTPAGVEPHDLELSSSQIMELLDADLVLYVGQGFQPAVEDALEQADVPSYDALQGQDLMEGAEDEHGHEEEEEADEDEHASDPHVWLDPSILAGIGREVAARLADLDPAHASAFESNASAFEDELIELDNAYVRGLEECSRREFVVSHEAFGYLAARYDLEQIGVAGIDPEAEPSPQRLAEVARFVADHDVRVIFFEELASPDLAQTLARETGAEVDVLSPLETQPESGGYIDEMERNLERLRSALDCA
jgi:zinc transport system substrate-binding protein